MVLTGEICVNDGQDGEFNRHLTIRHPMASLLPITPDRHVIRIECRTGVSTGNNNSQENYFCRLRSDKKCQETEEGGTSGAGVLVRVKRDSATRVHFM